jgi:ketosteroid isomerase-like protein
MGRMRKKALQALALLTGCIGLAAFVLACSKPADNSTAAAEVTIQRQEADWFKAIGAGQLDATVSYYGDGAVLLAPNVPIARTKEEIRRTWMQIFASVPAGATFSGETTKVEVARSGDLAYAIGTYAFATPAIDKGKFVDVWKKQADGSWKDVVGMINSDLPASPPTT